MPVEPKQFQDGSFSPRIDDDAKTLLLRQTSVLNSERTTSDTTLAVLTSGAYQPEHVNDAQPPTRSFVIGWIFMHVMISRSIFSRAERCNPML
jgi:hypothetical protein